MGLTEKILLVQERDKKRLCRHLRRCSLQNPVLDSLPFLLSEEDPLVELSADRDLAWSLWKINSLLGGGKPALFSESKKARCRFSLRSSALSYLQAQNRFQKKGQSSPLPQVLLISSLLKTISSLCYPKLCPVMFKALWSRHRIVTCYQRCLLSDFLSSCSRLLSS